MTTYTVSPTGVSTPDLALETYSPNSSPLSVPKVPWRTIPEAPLSSRPTRVVAVSAQQSPLSPARWGPSGEEEERNRRI